MATLYEPSAPPGGHSAFASDQAFFRRMAVGVALFIVFAFAQWSLRGFTDPASAPLWVHLHGLACLGWLGLFVTQNVLAERGSLALHRRLGWLGLALVVAMIGLGSFTGVMAIILHRQPPFFTPAFFLALTHVQITFFGALVAAGIALRRQTEWHRRLMLSATVLIMEPAFGRLLPAPLIGAELSEWIAASLQVGVLAIAMRHDARTRGAVHPALWWGAAAVIAMHGTISLLARFGPVQALAASLAGA